MRQDRQMTITPDELLPELLELAVRAARAAGAELMTRYGRIEGLDMKSSATDPVSDADRAAETLLVRIISAQRPHDGLLGEEGAAKAGSSGITWVVDPLDGTVNYLYELDNFSVSVAAEDSAGPVVGVVYDPTRDSIYTAARGRGAHRDGAELNCTAAVAPERALVGTGFGYSAERRRIQGSVIGGLLPQVRDIRRIGSAALDLCAVAAGALDAYWEEGVNQWDVSAGSLIATEAGAVFSNIDLLGFGRGALAAAPELHAALGVVLAELVAGVELDRSEGAQ